MRAVLAVSELLAGGVVSPERCSPIARDRACGTAVDAGPAPPTDARDDAFVEQDESRVVEDRNIVDMREENV